MTAPTQVIVNSTLIMIFGSILSFLSAWFWFAKNAAVARAKTIADEQVKTLERLKELETKLALINQAIIPISTAFQAILIKELTHFHTPEMDALLVKLGPPNTLSATDMERLEVLLVERAKDMAPKISASERDAACILPVIIKRAQKESDLLANAEVSKVKLVTVSTLVGSLNFTQNSSQRSSPGRRAEDALKIIDDHVAPNQQAEVSLKKIEQNTAASAEVLKKIEERAASKLVTTVVEKSKEK